MPQHMTAEFKEIVLKVKTYFKAEKNNGIEAIELNNVTKRTAQCLGISERSVVRVSSEERASSTGKVSQAKPRSGRPKVDIDDFLKGVIRRKILNFYMEKRFPTILELHQRLIDECPDFPQVCSTTLKKWVKEMNFAYKKLENRPILMEANAIAAKRAEYLHAIKKYRETGWNIFFTDETWCGANHSRKFGWVEFVTPENRASFDQYRGTIQEINGFRGGIKRPSGSGLRVIILDIGNENGFLPSCTKCFIGKKGSADYHDEMNKQHYEEWLRYVLGVIPDKSVIVLDQAPYHTMLDPEFRNPTTSWKKVNIIEWLNKRKVPLPEQFDTFNQMTRPSLLELSRIHNYKKQYLLEKVVKDLRQEEVKLLWLPVAHCEFNPIELIWAYVKNKVAKENTTFKIKDVLELCRVTLQNVPNIVWANCVDHAKKVEDLYREKENLVDVVIEPLVINLADDEDGSDNDFEYIEDSDSENDCL